MDIIPRYPNGQFVFCVTYSPTVPKERSVMKLMTAWKTMHLSQILGHVKLSLSPKTLPLDDDKQVFKAT
ncbi:hypothetical protein KIN20_037540 [Parelaphostrongylus tenuis]|uniref:Uncharacterized protein n=1 Tax=Parelaphostrongylus tenuis TaxID=148309 RepID=A0AAD5RES4_PARTN|nr:hypothetical protein KIN20_037540 [Parelaphostrongylus tenuis]